uniref:Ig-like domain-containing protein n=1 Tax=Macrostomum lignano TaxID=282301 RepID=A0A1I8IPP9_9PLAT
TLAEVQVIRGPSDVSARENASVSLACRTALPSSAVKVVWNRDGVIVASSSLRSLDPRYKITASPAADSGEPGVHDLLISPLQMQDQGEYYCQVSESDSSRRSWPIGDPLTLACSASGSNPAAALVWLFGDGESAAADENRIRTPTVEGEAGRSAFYRPFSGSIRLEKRVESAVDKL